MLRWDSWKTNIQPATAKSPRLNINLEPFDRDERTRSVENTLALLIESRFGPGSVYEPVQMIFAEWPADTVNYELMPTGSWSLITGSISYDSTNELASEAVSRSCRSSLAPASAFLSHRSSPSTLARGSP
ncbi:hypothetical protein BH20ACI2_BH20ACI2_23550 [soil metagenome]